MTEAEIAVLEGCRNESEDLYFAARPGLDNEVYRKVFRAAFDRGWVACDDDRLGVGDE